MKERVFTALVAVVVSAVSAQESVERVSELDLSSNVTVTVPDGATKRIEYVSGTANVSLIKEGGGTLEVAIVGNTNAAFFVNGGKLKFVRPGKLALAADEAAFHVDGSDMDSMEISVENGTNFVTKMKDVAGRSTYAERYSTRPNPYLAQNSLNGLTVFDFGSMYGSGVSGYGAAMKWSEIHLPFDIFYVWSDDPDARKQATENSIGPTPVNMQYSGYRGKGGAGVSFILSNTTPDKMDNVVMDDVKVDPRTHRPSDGWHYVKTTSKSEWQFTTSNTNSYSARGFGFRPSGPSPYGGFKLAEMLICTNYLTAAKREYVNFYLKRKWFGGYPVKKIVLAEGALLDASDAPVSVTHFQVMGNASVNGLENIRMSHPSGASTNVVVSAGVYNAKDRKESMIPNIEFVDNGEIVIDAGTNAANIVEGSGLFKKSGDGSLSVGYLGNDFSSLTVASGQLTVSPLLTPAELHVDAADTTAFSLSEENGTNFVSRWEDVLRNGQALKQTSDKYAYGDNEVIKRPFLVENRQNGLPMVDFGSQSDAEHQDGWGAMLDVVKPILRSDVSGGSQRVTADQFGVLQVFSVWEDDPASFERAYVEDKNGVLKPTIGPVLYGNGYSWYRGAGGAGVGFPFCSMTGPSTVREEMWLDNVRFYSQYVRFTPIEKGVHIMDQRIGVAEGGSGISVVGGNRDCATTNGPYAAVGVYGGVRIGEVMAFRHYLPLGQRTQIRNALGVKWFGTEKYSHGYGFEDVTISQGASLSLPYAEVSVTNLTIAGDFSSRSISVSTALIVSGDSTVSAPLSLKSGGTFTLARNGAGGFFAVEADAFSIEPKGRIEISDWDGILCGQSYRVVETASLTGNASGWSGRNADGTLKARFEKRTDGLYLKFESGGTRIIIR
jgi:hypothetical protein